MNNSRHVAIALAILLLGNCSQAIINVEELDYSNSTCQRYSPCNNTDEIVQAILTDEGNYQRLVEAFFPINHARPQSVLIIFFTNGTSISKEVCIEREPYYGMLFELNGIKNVYGTVWYASTMNTVISEVTVHDMALLIPQYFLGQFLRVSPVITDYVSVCLTIPYLKPPDGMNSEIDNAFLPVIMIVSYIIIIIMIMNITQEIIIQLAHCYY